jgi:hypothetical protein
MEYCCAKFNNFVDKKTIFHPGRTNPDWYMWIATKYSTNRYSAQVEPPDAYRIKFCPWCGASLNLVICDEEDI